MDSESDWTKTILNQVQQLSILDIERMQFGSRTHEYRFGEPLSLAECQAIEIGYGITLPDDFRQFVTHAGNGGVGPGYGLQRFLLARSANNPPLTKDVRMNQHSESEVCSSTPQKSSEACDDDEQADDEWERRYYEFATNHVIDEAIGRKRLAESFPLEEPFRVLTDEMWNRNRGILNEAENREVSTRRQLFKRIPLSQGALQLADYGCGITAYLVLNGRFRGDIWIYDPTNGDFVPAPFRSDLHDTNETDSGPTEEPRIKRSISEMMQEIFAKTRQTPTSSRSTFREWYEHWLTSELQTLPCKYTPEQIAARIKARELFKSFDLSNHEVIASGKMGDTKFTLSQPKPQN